MSVHTLIGKFKKNMAMQEQLCSEIRCLAQAKHPDERVASVKLLELDTLGADLFKISDSILDLDTTDPATLNALAMVVLHYFEDDAGLPQEAAMGLARGVLKSHNQNC